MQSQITVQEVPGTMLIYEVAPINKGGVHSALNSKHCQSTNSTKHNAEVISNYNCTFCCPEQTLRISS